MGLEEGPKSSKSRRFIAVGFQIKTYIFFSEIAYRAMWFRIKDMYCLYLLDFLMLNVSTLLLARQISLYTSFLYLRKARQWALKSLGTLWKVLVFFPDIKCFSFGTNEWDIATYTSKAFDICPYLFSFPLFF